MTLQDGALVIRGGLMLPADLATNSSSSRVRFGYYGISAWTGSGMTVLELALAGNIKHGFIRKSTAMKIRAAGFEIVLTGPPSHCTIRLGNTLADKQLIGLSNAFDPPETNPRWRK